MWWEGTLPVVCDCVVNVVITVLTLLPVLTEKAILAAQGAMSDTCSDTGNDCSTLLTLSDTVTHQGSWPPKLTITVKTVKKGDLQTCPKVCKTDDVFLSGFRRISRSGHSD